MYLFDVFKISKSILILIIVCTCINVLDELSIIVVLVLYYYFSPVFPGYRWLQVECFRVCRSNYIVHVFSKPLISWDAERNTKYSQTMLHVQVMKFSSWIGGTYRYSVFYRRRVHELPFEHPEVIVFCNCCIYFEL